MKEYQNLIQDILKAPKIQLKKKNYIFKNFAVGERGTDLSPQLVQEVLDSFLDKIYPYKESLDYIISAEPGGNQWGLLVAHSLRKPLKIIRKTTGYGEEFVVRQEGILYTRDLCFSGFKSGDKVIIIDDVVSTGGTLKIIINTLKNLGVKVIGAYCIISKGDGYKKIEKSEDIPIQSLIQVDENGDLIV